MCNIIKKFFKLFNKNNDLICKNSLKRYTSPIKILIDNGHGNNTLGKRSPYSCTGVEPKIDFYEYEWNREIAIRINTELSLLNYDVELLVSEIEDISLSERVKRVNKHCDKLGKDNVVLISIHSNAVGNGNKWEKAQGWEAYTSIGSTMSDKLSSIFYKNAELMFPNRRIRYDWTDKDADKEENFYILKNTKCPAILTENFFYDNIDDVNFILSDEGKEKVVELHVKSIIEYLSDEDKTY